MDEPAPAERMVTFRAGESPPGGLTPVLQVTDLGDHLVGMMGTPHIAALVVAGVNGLTNDQASEVLASVPVRPQDPCLRCTIMDEMLAAADEPATAAVKSQERTLDGGHDGDAGGSFGGARPGGGPVDA